MKREEALVKLREIWPEAEALAMDYDGAWCIYSKPPEYIAGEWCGGYIGVLPSLTIDYDGTPGYSLVAVDDLPSLPRVMDPEPVHEVVVVESEQGWLQEYMDGTRIRKWFNFSDHDPSTFTLTRQKCGVIVAWPNKLSDLPPVKPEPPEPTYRPYTFEESREKLRDAWLRHRKTRQEYRVGGFDTDDEMIQWGSSWRDVEEVFCDCEYLDGSPCGVEEETDG